MSKTFCDLYVMLLLDDADGVSELYRKFITFNNAFPIRN